MVIVPRFEGVVYTSPWMKEIVQRQSWFVNKGVWRDQGVRTSLGKQRLFSSFEEGRGGGGGGLPSRGSVTHRSSGL